MQLQLGIFMRALGQYSSTKIRLLLVDVEPVRILGAVLGIVITSNQEPAALVRGKKRREAKEFVHRVYDMTYDGMVDSFQCWLVFLALQTEAAGGVEAEM